jgi:hypothetical protein
MLHLLSHALPTGAVASIVEKVARILLLLKLFGKS